MRRISLFVLVLTSTLLFSSAFAQSPRFGHFEGKVVAEWHDDGRRMHLLSDFRYVESNNTGWLAPKGSVIDGASIPRVFWTFIGGPFEGKYRNASVVHDVACDERKRSWQSVHRMFYWASRAGGVGPLNAFVMFGAVVHFGPRWAMPKKSSSIISLAYAQDVPARSLTTEDDFLRMREYIIREYKLRGGELSLKFIEGLTSAFLKSEIPDIPASARMFRGLLQEPGI